MKEKKTKYCALTFDDGPDNYITDLILKKLENFNVKATFFMVGNKINESTEGIVRKIVSMGNEIGNHSWNHDVMDKMTTEEINKSVSDTTKAIEKYSGTTPIFFRPPNLLVSPKMFEVISYPFVGGILAYDWEGQNKSAQDIAGTILNKVEDGSVILLHDSQPLPHYTPEALEIIIPELMANGFIFVTLRELYRLKRG